MELDIEYFTKLRMFLNGKYNATVQDLNSTKVTNDKEKLIFHLKYHIDNGNNPAVEFNSDYTKFKVYDNGLPAQHKLFNLNTIDPEFWIIIRKRRGYVSIMNSVEPINEVKKTKNSKKKKPETNNEYTDPRIQY